MIKRNNFFITCLVIFALFAGCSRDVSERKYRRPHFKHPHKDVAKFGHCRIDKMAEDLDLSTDQIEALKELEKEIMKKQFEMRQNKKHRDVIKEKIVEMIKKDSLSKEEIIVFMDELHSLGEELRKETDSFVAERLAKMHSILTKEQREELAKKLEEFEPRRKFKPESKTKVDKE